VGFSPKHKKLHPRLLGEFYTFSLKKIQLIATHLRLKIIVTVVIILTAGASWLRIKPPALFKFGSNFTAKIVRSNDFLANW